MKPQLREDSVIGLFSQVPLVNFSMVHFSTIYKNVLFLHSPQKKKKKIETVKRWAGQWNCCDLCLPKFCCRVWCEMCTKAGSQEKENDISGKEFSPYGWRKKPSSEDVWHAFAKAGTVIQGSLGLTL